MIQLHVFHNELSEVVDFIVVTSIFYILLALSYRDHSPARYTLCALIGPKTHSPFPFNLNVDLGIIR